MKRKIIKLAETTYVVSLPLSWIKRFNVRKKDEVEVAEDGSSILVSLPFDKSALSRKTEIDVTTVSQRIAEWMIAAAHKAGFDEIKVHYRKEQIRFILDYVKDHLLGFFVTSQTEDYCILKIVSREDGSEFDNLLRRSFLVGLELAESSIELMRKSRYSEIRDLLHLEKTNNQLTLTCQRLVRKGLVKKNANELFLLSWHLENVVDDYRDLCKIVIEKKSGKLSHYILGIFGDVNAYFRGYYELFYKFDVEEMNRLDQEKNRIMRAIKPYFDQAPKDERLILSYLLSITTKISVFSATMMSINIAQSDTSSLPDK